MLRVVPTPDPRHSSIDADNALGHGVTALVEAALDGDTESVLEWARKLADRFERVGNLTAAARLRSLVRRSRSSDRSIEEPGAGY